MITKLPADVYSPDQIGIVLWELSNVISALRDSETRKAVVKTDGEEEIHVSHFLLGILTASGIETNDRKSLEELQAELLFIRDRAPVAHIVLPALPNRTLTRELVDWFRKNIHKQQLVTFSVRGDIGGGFLLRIGSNQHDFTFRGQLLANRHRIAEILDSVR
jgi:hypothetical protein